MDIALCLRLIQCGHHPEQQAGSWKCNVGMAINSSINREPMTHNTLRNASWHAVKLPQCALPERLTSISGRIGMSEVSIEEELEPLALTAALLPGFSLGFTQIKPAQHTCIFVTGPRMLCSELYCSDKSICMIKTCLHANVHVLQMRQWSTAKAVVLSHHWGAYVTSALQKVQAAKA